MSAGEDFLQGLLVDAGDLSWVREYVFAPPRRWRFDFAWPAHKLAVEVDGGTFTNGRHSRGMGYEKDCEKYNAAALQGWAVLRVTPRMLADGRAMDAITAYLA